ncbi:MAG: putative ABC transporter ATP-binding protein [Methanomassiliicoccales archaeon PtaB.Bin215]|nr:MAG: putative ABC transporter ATP-binding protein [Methanomassiliicoccales archaeon PtaB.Bin215]
MSENDSRPRPRGPGGFGPGHGPMMAGKPKSFKTAWKKMLAYMRPYIPALIVASILVIIGTVFTVIGPDRLSDLTDLIARGMMSGTIDLDGVAEIGTFLVIIYLLSAVLNYGQGFIVATIVQRLSKRLRTDISEKINRLPLRYFDRTSYGDVLSRVTNDVDTISMSMNQSVGMLMSAAALLIGSLVMMMYTDLVMTAAAVGAALAGFMLMALIMVKSQKYFERQQKHLGRLNGHVEEMYTGHVIVKAYNGEKAAQKEFDSINDELFDSAFKSLFLSGMMMPLMGFIGNFGYVAVCIVGAVQVLNGTITIGVIVAFMIYVRLFTQPLTQLAQAMTSLQSVAAASERVFEFLEEPEMENEGHKKLVHTDVKGDVEFRDVSFGYTPEREVIHHFSFHVRQGQKVAIVGPTGAGKTTIVNLLMRFYEVNSGDILIDGISTKELTRENVHDMFCMVLQDTWLFEGTIRENIAYRKEGVTDEMVEEACKAVGIHHFIATLPDGYHTKLDDESKISMGQRQQMTIARAVVQNAPLLILDEATSSVDTRTEKIIQKAMQDLTVGRTSFIIAHRLSTIKDADTILVMREGSIVESGTHEELLRQGGFYAGLYNSQFEDCD